MKYLIIYLLTISFSSNCQKFTVIIHSDTKLDLELEDIKNIDGSITSAVANFKKLINQQLLKLYLQILHLNNS